MGKGSKQRPTDHDAFSANFDAIFGKKEVIKEADVVKEENEDDDEEKTVVMSTNVAAVESSQATKYQPMR